MSDFSDFYLCISLMLMNPLRNQTSIFNFLLLHNVIGSPSNVVIRRSICQHFDTKLQWLVDVEWYVNLLNQTQGRWIIAKNIWFASQTPINNILITNVVSTN